MSTRLRQIFALIEAFAIFAGMMIFVVFILTYSMWAHMIQ